MASATTELKDALAQVGKLLALEEKQGYHDRAVIGGIGPYARQHLAALRGSLPSRSADDTLARIAGLLRDYGTLTPAARAPRLSAALADLRQLYRQVNQVGENDPTAQPRYVGPRKAPTAILQGRADEGRTGRRPEGPTAASPRRAPRPDHARIAPERAPRRWRGARDAIRVTGAEDGR